MLSFTKLNKQGESRASYKGKYVSSIFLHKDGKTTADFNPMGRASLAMLKEIVAEMERIEGGQKEEDPW